MPPSEDERETAKQKADEILDLYPDSETIPFEHFLGKTEWLDHLPIETAVTLLQRMDFSIPGQSILVITQFLRRNKYSLPGDLAEMPKAKRSKSTLPLAPLQEYLSCIPDAKKSRENGAQFFKKRPAPPQVEQTLMPLDEYLEKYEKGTKAGKNTATPQ